MVNSDGFGEVSWFSEFRSLTGKLRNFRDLNGSVTEVRMNLKSELALRIFGTRDEFDYLKSEVESDDERVRTVDQTVSNKPSGSWRSQ